ncbi:MAG: CHAP domain-containing protein [Actinomycetia bacterium]|nr:CHAP domain-containing protein [Actinomycetes bacterium]
MKQEQPERDNNTWLCIRSSNVVRYRGIMRESRGGLCNIIQILAIACFLVVLSALSFISGPAHSRAGCFQNTDDGVDVVLVEAEEWNGVDVYDNRKPHSNPTDYEYGQKWQCVELVQRLYAEKWGYPSIWPVRYGYEMFEKAPVGIEKHANGDKNSSPVWGDVIVFGSLYEGDVGHVSIVTGVEGGRVFLVHQNFGDEGKATITIDGNNNLGKLGLYQPLGWLHPAGEYTGPRVVVGGGASNAMLLILFAVMVICLTVSIFFFRGRKRIVGEGSGHLPEADMSRLDAYLATSRRRARYCCVAGMLLFYAILIGSGVVIASCASSGHNELVPLVDVGRSLVSVETRLLALSVAAISIAIMCISAQLFFCQCLRDIERRGADT